jgi:hypothetical protein
MTKAQARAISGLGHNASHHGSGTARFTRTAIAKLRRGEAFLELVAALDRHGGLTIALVHRATRSNSRGLRTQRDGRRRAAMATARRLARGLTRPPVDADAPVP